jgi:hypothetical protein
MLGEISVSRRKVNSKAPAMRKRIPAVNLTPSPVIKKQIVDILGQTALNVFDRDKTVFDL